MVGSTGCCYETEAFGLVLIIIAAFVNLIVGVGCCVAGVLMFILKKDYGQTIRILYLIGLIIVGILISICAIIILIAFTISADGRNAAIACFSIAFFIELVLLCILGFAFFHSWKRGDYFNVNLVAILVIPVAMAFCVLGVLILLIERGNLGRSSLTIIIIVCIVLSFLFFIGLVIATAFLIVQTARGHRGMFMWMVIALLVIGAIVDLIGVILTAFVNLSLTVAAVGFILCGIVTAAIMITGMIYWFLSARHSEYLAYKWSILGMGTSGAFFLAVALIGLLCVGGLWILNLKPGIHDN